MRKSRFTEEQIIGILREVDAGAEAREVCRRHGIAEMTFYRWRRKYGDMEVTEAKRLRQLEDENARLMEAGAAAESATLCIGRRLRPPSLLSRTR